MGFRRGGYLRSAGNRDTGPVTMSPYAKLGASLGISFLVMWVLTMSMIREWDHFYFNLSNAWMALIMVSPMGLIMLGVMWAMFPNRAVNIALLVGFTALFTLAFVLGRAQAGIGDEQFLKSMIPHHSRAILACEESDINDPEIIRLCGEIIETQRDEIEQMEDILDRR
jgi:hypothetical protein